MGWVNKYSDVSVFTCVFENYVDDSHDTDTLKPILLSHLSG